MLAIKRAKYLRMLAVTAFILLSAVACEMQPYSNPPLTFEDSALVGTWEATYSHSQIDRLLLRADGTFKQVYVENWRGEGKDYVYETQWNPWWVERSLDGRVRLHLKGARYLRLGHEWAARLHDQGFYDPVADAFLEMVEELVLNVRRRSSGELILLHMWEHGDRGYILFGGSGEEFHRVEGP